jgi:hypothetical protein
MSKEEEMVTVETKFVKDGKDDWVFAMEDGVPLVTIHQEFMEKMNIPKKARAITGQAVGQLIVGMFKEVARMVPPPPPKEKG